MSSAQQKIVGFIETTVTFWAPVYDLTHYDATTMDEAATNALKWYNDGSAALADDITDAKLSITTRPITADSYDDDDDDDDDDDGEYIIAVMPTTSRRIDNDTVIIIEGVPHPIKTITDDGYNFAPKRVIETLKDLGYKPATDYYSDIERTYSGYTIKIVPVK